MANGADTVQSTVLVVHSGGEQHRLSLSLSVSLSLSLSLSLSEVSSCC